MRSHAVTLLVALGFALAVLLSLVLDVRAACRLTAREDYNPTGWEGCSSYGTGRASWWGGPGVATNDCLWPWTACALRRITSLDTGRNIVVRPTMFCDCYTRTADQRMVDLDPAALRALGLWEIRDQGLFRVRVEPVELIPDTASAAP